MPGGGLEEYRQRRSFDHTPEPAGRRHNRSGAQPVDGEQSRFVIQEHHARRLHWDLRIERDGVLASWALPRGLPESPDENHLAVHTEDHPLGYLTFHGEIPSGEYGAGGMTVWDTGTCTIEKFEETKVRVRFHGERARGTYALFQTRGRDWIIHRMDPPEPSGDPMPRDLEPMHARAGALPGDDASWAFEVEWDGERVLAYGDPGRVRLVAAGGGDVTGRYLEIGQLARPLGARRTVLDGAVCAFDDGGLPSADRLARRQEATTESELRRRRRDVPVVYVVFDLLYLDGRSLLEVPYEQRRAELDGLGLDGAAWQAPQPHRGDGAEFLAASRDRGLPAIVAKRLDSPYRPGTRSSYWRRVSTTPARRR